MRALQVLCMFGITIGVLCSMCYSAVHALGGRGIDLLKGIVSMFVLIFLMIKLGQMWNL